ncbi:MAG: TatD family hydrolase [Bryobacterales bacterium]|nr:TatD family hydrolase [Bryobacterales bacterium]
MTTRREFLQTAAVSVVAATSVQCTHVSKVNANLGAGKAARTGVVQTVLGPIDASKLGFTLTHEHVGSGSEKIFSSRANSVADAVDKLKEARDAGIRTIVDLSTFDTGRDIRYREEISRKSGMQIVAATGQHVYAAESYNARTIEEITEYFIKEIEQGIDGTDIKAGVIKVAARSDVMTPTEDKVFKAAARASKATGIAIETHTHARRRAGEKQAVVLEAEGVSPARVSFGHSDDTDDVNYLIGLARRGYTLGMDHTFWGMAPGAMLPWQKRADCITKLIEAGYVGRMFLSNDWVHGDVDREAVNPDGMLFTIRKTIPYLKQNHVSDQSIRAMTVENPRRFFGRQA